MWVNSALEKRSREGEKGAEEGGKRQKNRWHVASMGGGGIYRKFQWGKEEGDK